MGLGVFSVVGFFGGEGLNLLPLPLLFFGGEGWGWGGSLWGRGRASDERALVGGFGWASARERARVCRGVMQLFRSPVNLRNTVKL